MERREHTRHRFWLPVEIERDGPPGGGAEAEGAAGARVEGGEVAVSHDVSPGGLLLVCRSDLPVDARLRVRLRVPPVGSDGQEAVLEARVVRSMRNDEDPHGLWPYKVALELSCPSPLLTAYLAQHSSSPAGR